MNSAYGEQVNEELSALRSPDVKDNTNFKIPQSVASKARNKKNNAINYSDISLTMTGEISSTCIYRSNLTQKFRSSFTGNIEDDNNDDDDDDDEQFILNMKRNIDSNRKTQEKENYGIKDLQSKSYLSRKRRSVFSEEDQTLIKRFKSSVDEKRDACMDLQALRRSNNAIFGDTNYSMATSTPRNKPSVTVNDTNTNLRENTDRFFFQMASRTQKDDKVITLDNAKVVTETGIEELVYCELQYFTPPERSVSE